METNFWLQRWREGRTGFHRDRVMPLLTQHWDALALSPGSRVFVPLAGKSLDMLWLAAQGYRVLGVELSSLAVQQFFADNDLRPEVHDSRYGRHHVAGAIELICGDAFALDAAALADCASVYDRAAVIALPADMRRRYAEELYARLPAGCRGLMITLEYPQAEKVGPPFSVDEREVRSVFGARWQIDLLDRRDILDSEPGFVAEGVSALATAVYRLRRASD
ncbi:MAG: thiopurine S-methyltransferase [Dokdonella sp.]